MKNTLKWIVLFVILIISSCVLGQIDVRVVQTLYTVLGILFSVVMSLIISFSTNDVLNLKKKEEIRRKNSDIEKKCILCFLVVTILFIILDNGVLPIMICKISISVYYSNINAMILVLSIIFYILKFNYIKKSKNEIEDIISKEKQ